MLLDWIMVGLAFLPLLAFLVMIERNISGESAPIEKQVAVIGIIAGFLVPAGLALGWGFVAIAGAVAWVVLTMEHGDLLLNWGERAFG
jgi:hypothetical protein